MRIQSLVFFELNIIKWPKNDTETVKVEEKLKVCHLCYCVKFFRTIFLPISRGRLMQGGSKVNRQEELWRAIDQCGKIPKKYQESIRKENTKKARRFRPLNFCVLYPSGIRARNSECFQSIGCLVLDMFDVFTELPSPFYWKSASTPLLLLPI